MNDMSFLTILTLVSLTVPGIAQLIQGVVLNFIYKDILQTDKWLFQLFFDEGTESIDSPLNSYFDDNGFSSRFFIKSAGSAVVFLALYLALLLSMLPLGLVGCYSTM